MSRSRTYRPAYLSEEARQELAQRARQARFREDLLPVLREHIRHQAAGIAAQGGLPQSIRVDLEERLSIATTAESLRTIATALIPTAGLAASATTREITPSSPPAHLTPNTISASPASQVADSELAGLHFDLVHLSRELASLFRTAQGLGLGLVGEAGARQSVHALEEALDRGDPSVAKAAEVQARAHVERLDQAVSEALAAAECVTRTTEDVHGALASMGFRVGRVTSRDAEAVLVARRSDGRTARVVVSGTDGMAGCSVEFTDPGDSVPSDHHASEEICEPAVGDSVDFHRRLAQSSDLELGPIEAAARPTRGSAGASRSGSSRAARRSMFTNPRIQRRST